jgi:hypothetical protein
MPSSPSLYAEGAVDNMFEWEFKGEVTPEELRKRFEEYENEPGYLKSMVIDYLMPYMVREILRTKADAMTKAQAIFYLGELYGALEGLDELYLQFTLPRIGPYEELMKNYAFIIRSTADKLIYLYRDLKEGRRPLEEIKESLKYFASDVEFSSFNYNVQPIIKYIQELKPS